MPTGLPWKHGRPFCVRSGSDRSHCSYGGSTRNPGEKLCRLSADLCKHIHDRRPEHRKPPRRDNNKKLRSPMAPEQAGNLYEAD